MGIGSYRAVSIFNGVVRNGLTKKTTLEASKAEPCRERHSRQREQEMRRPQVLSLLPCRFKDSKGTGSCLSVQMACKETK